MIVLALIPALRAELSQQINLLQQLFIIFKEKLVIFQSIGIIVIKSKETGMITYTCWYFTGYLIPIIQLCQDELGIKCPLEYLQV